MPENQPSGTTVGTFSSTDQDLPAQTFTYALVSGTGADDNTSFSIVGNTLKTMASFDFETQASYSIRVQATDSGSPALSASTVRPCELTSAKPPWIAISSGSPFSER